MLRMVWFFYLFVLYLALTVASQDSVKLITLHDTSALHDLSQNGEPLAVSVQNEHLKEVSSSVLVAESWLRNNVLAHYQGTNITTIVVGHTLRCEKDQEDKLHLVLSSVKNLYYSLTRWGLQKEIKVSASFGSSCFQSNSDDTYLQPLISFLHDINSPYVVNAPPKSSDALLASHSKAMKNLGFLKLNKINVVISKPREARPTSRKLSFFDSKIVDPFSPRPTPLAPINAPIGFSLPPYAAEPPLAPLVGDVSPPPLTLPFAPQLPPEMSPTSPHYGPHLPPCTPSDGEVVHSPAPGLQSGLWCVAKPSVPPETLQVSLDYACNEGGADCEGIQPNANCYVPDSVVAHASYAFNSYWQKTKRNGGTCGFGGTAMLINSDPSFGHCRFMLA